MVCFFKQKTAYEMRISDWSSDVCSSDLGLLRAAGPFRCPHRTRLRGRKPPGAAVPAAAPGRRSRHLPVGARRRRAALRSEEHTSELQSLMRISYAVFCLKKKRKICKILQRHIACTKLHSVLIKNLN